LALAGASLISAFKILPDDAPVAFLPGAKRRGTGSGRRYAAYQGCTKVGQLRTSAQRAWLYRDLIYDVRLGYLRIAGLTADAISPISAARSAGDMGDAIDDPNGRSGQPIQGELDDGTLCPTIPHLHDGELDDGTLCPTIPHHTGELDDGTLLEALCPTIPHLHNGELDDGTLLEALCPTIPHLHNGELDDGTLLEALCPTIPHLHNGELDDGTPYHLGPPVPANDSDEGDPGPLRQPVEAELLVQTGQTEFDDAQLMIQAQGATLTQHVVSAGHEAAGLETAEEYLNAAEESANQSFNNALQESENGTKVLREQAAAIRVLMNARKALESQYILTPQGQAIWHGLYVRLGIIHAYAQPERDTRMPSSNPARAKLPYHDQHYERVNEALEDVNSIIGHLRDLHDANEARRMVPSYASTSAQLRTVSCAAAAMRDAINQLADRRLTYLRRAHRAHMPHGAQGLHRLREHTVGATAGAAEGFSRLADPRALRVLVGPSSHHGGWALATMDIRETCYNLGGMVGLALPHHGFETNNGGRPQGTMDVHGAYYFGRLN
jgi:hypothetical protein